MSLSWTPPAPLHEPGAFITQVMNGEPSWPAPLAPEAMHGLAGQAVAGIAPHSEADIAAILAHYLAGVGCMIGPHVYAMAGDAEHPARLNVGIVGETSKGRKGSAMRPVERVLAGADADFPARIAEGLSSGEGLIWQVRDPIERLERNRDGTTEMVMVDAGIADKRALFVESELAGTLRVAAREGNTLSPLIRRAWDSGTLRTLTKTSPATATGAHIAIIGHVSRDELLRYLDRTELASGLANRFLWIAARRSQLLPDGEGVPGGVLADLAAELRAVRVWAATPRHIARDPAAATLWREVYAELSDGRPGLFGATVNRAEAQVLRLSVLYAALDRSPVVNVEHLAAALAVWSYAEQSARWIFGDAIGDPTADAIRAALRRSGELTRTELIDLFGRHVNRGSMDRALGALLTAGLATRTMQETGGRPREVWRAA